MSEEIELNDESTELRKVKRIKFVIILLSIESYQYLKLIKNEVRV